MSARSRMVAASSDSWSERTLIGSAGVMRARLIRDAARRVELARAKVNRTRFAPDQTAVCELNAAYAAWYQLTAADYQTEEDP